MSEEGKAQFDYESVGRLLRKGALTPQEIQNRTTISLSRLAEILPSKFNQEPLLPGIHYKPYKGERFFPVTKPKFMLYLDHGFAWRYFTLYSYNRDLLVDALELQRVSMNKESQKRIAIAEKIVKDLITEACKVFKLNKRELGYVFSIAVRGSTVRGDAKPEDDIDFFILFDENFFSPGDRETILEYLVFSNILNAYEKYKIHISLQAVGDLGFIKACRELIDPYLAFFFFTTQSYFGDSFYTKVYMTFKRTPAYRKIQKKLKYAREEPLTFDKLVFDLAFIHKTDKERKEMRESELAKLKRDVKRLKIQLGL